MDMVADGTIKYTIADENLARINASYKPILNIDVPISLSQQIAWVTRKKSKKLRDVVNKWIKAKRNTTNYAVINTLKINVRFSVVQRVTIIALRIMKLVNTISS